MSGDRTADVLDAIDGALDDWSVSGDAMRWTPEPPSPDLIVTLTVDTSRVIEAFAIAAEQAGRALAQFAAAFKFPLPPAPVDTHHLRSAYRRKALARRRRNRK